MTLILSGRRRSASVVPAESQYEATQNQARNYRKAKLEVVSNNISQLILNAPELAASFAEYRTDCLGHSVCHRPLRVARFIDGYVLAGSTRTDDARQSHRLQVPDGGEVKYVQRTAYDTYSEQVATPIECVGNDALSESAAALEGMALLYDLVKAEQANGWPNVYKLSELHVYHI